MLMVSCLVIGSFRSSLAVDTHCLLTFGHLSFSSSKETCMVLPLLTSSLFALIIISCPCDPTGAFGSEKRHRSHLRHEDFKKGRHAGEGTGNWLVTTLLHTKSTACPIL